MDSELTHGDDRTWRPIDGHAHVFRSTDFGPRFVGGSFPADRDEPIETYLSIASEVDVKRAVLVPIADEDSYISGILEAHPNRFVGVATFDRTLVPGEVTPLEHMLHRRHSYPYAAIRITRLGDPRTAEFDEGIPELLTWMSENDIVLWSYLGPGQLALLDKVMLQLPTLPVALNHLGLAAHDMQLDQELRPWFADPLPSSVMHQIQRVAQYPRVYVLLSGMYAISRENPPYADLDEKISPILTWFGPRRVVWGSDYPLIRFNPGYRATFESPMRWLSGLTEVEKRAVYCENIRDLFSGRFHEEEEE